MGEPRCARPPDDRDVIPRRLSRFGRARAWSACGGAAELAATAAYVLADAGSVHATIPVARAMARIGILEPHGDVRELISLVVARLGHEPVTRTSRVAETLDSIGVLVVEPGSPEALEVATLARALSPTLPIVCVSIFTKTPAAAALDPVAYVLKPFALAELESAVQGSLVGAHAVR